MKERTYGWYPAVRDIYRSKNEPTPYHLECLYKFKESGYHNAAVESPEPAFVIRGIKPTSPPTNERPATSFSDRRSSQTATRRPKSVPVPKFQPVPKLNIPTPFQAWKEDPVISPDTSPKAVFAESAQCISSDGDHATNRELIVNWPAQQSKNKYDKPFVTKATTEDIFGTPLLPHDPGCSGGDSGYVFIPTANGGVEVHSPPLYWPEHSASSRVPPDAVEIHKDERSEDVLKEQEEKKKQANLHHRFEKLLLNQQQPEQTRPPHPPTSSSNLSFRRDRVRSATSRREKVGIPQRPVHSARPAVYQSREKYFSQADTVGCEELGKGRDEEMTQQQLTNSLPVDPESNQERPEARSPDQEYQRLIDKYGWRAQIPGDPYNIKKISKRLPYSIKCSAAVTLAPEPPKVHMECKETFFLNTIPRRTTTFTIHQDWISEGLHAQRMELQKRDGLKYRYKTFGFVY